jgi:anaerobic ribonucleoside-triphosphate reductase activating protein
MIRLADIINESIVDGIGVRVVVFLQGCINNCEGCRNPDLKPLEGGQEITEQELADLVLGILTPIHRGITFSGGEPMLQADKIVEVISRIKNERPDLDFWLYTGYLYEEYSGHSVMEQIDVVVDGPFIQGERNASCVFFGSANQRLIDVKESQRLGKTIQIEPERAFC